MTLARFSLVLALLAPAASSGADAPDPALEHQVRVLGAKFRGGRGCDPEAFEELKALRDEHGAQGVVGQGMALAYRGCDDDVGWAQLFAARIEPQDGDDDRLKLAAAWLLAGKWAEAHAVALPLAKAQGPESRAAWLVGYTLFQMDDRDAARPWLLGARGTVDGKERTDAPVMLAWVQLEAGEAAAAKAELEDAVAKMPDEFSLQAVRAHLLTRLGETEAAEDAASRARELARAAEVRGRRAARVQALDRAWVHAHRDGDEAAAVALVDRIVAEGDPKEVMELFERRASALAAKGDGAVLRRVRSHIRTLKRRTAG